MVFRALPDRGYLLARPLGLLLLTYVPWLLASLGWIGFGRTSIALGFLLTALISGWLAYRSRESLLSFVRRRWRLLLAEEALFLIAFLAFVLVRAANPDLWHPYLGGEKPMDFAYLNAVLRSTTMPPMDPWFAGGALNYYYYGQFMVATIIRATGIPSAVAYNLAVPLFFFALTAGTAFSLGYNITEGARRWLRRAIRPPRWERDSRGRSRSDDDRRLGQPARRRSAPARRSLQLRLLGAHAHDAAGPARLRDHGVPLLQPSSSPTSTRTSWRCPSRCWPSACASTPCCFRVEASRHGDSRCRSHCWR